MTLGYQYLFYFSKLPVTPSRQYCRYFSEVIFNSLGGDFSVFHIDRKSTRLNSSHLVISYAVFCLKKKKNNSDYNDSNTIASFANQLFRHHHTALSDDFAYESF